MPSTEPEQCQLYSADFLVHDVGWRRVSVTREFAASWTLHALGSRHDIQAKSWRRDR